MRRCSRLCLAVALVALPVGVTACGGDDDEESGQAPPAQTTPERTTPEKTTTTGIGEEQPGAPTPTAQEKAAIECVTAEGLKARQVNIATGNGVFVEDDQGMGQMIMYPDKQQAATQSKGLDENKVYGNVVALYQELGSKGRKVLETCAEEASKVE
jgi:predicted component of type VI protein secretion system